jgi:hypothetical protein
VIGSAGLATDTIQWALWKRQLQRTADSAAIAAVYGGIAGETKNDAVSRDMTHNSHVASMPAIAYLTPAAPYAADANAVRLQLSYSKSLSFSSFFLSAAPTITAEATATIVPSGEYCVVSLEEEAYTGIDATGSTVINMGCGMITNSPDDQAAVAMGSASVTASPMAAVGQIPASTGWGAGTVLQPFTLKQPDPFAGTPIPSPSGCQSFANQAALVNGSINGVVDFSTTRTNPNAVYCIKEGGSGMWDIKGDYRLGKGTYVLDATSLKMTETGAKLSCTGCTIILTNSSSASNAPIGTVDISGGTLNLQAPTSGTYDGILFYQDKRQRFFRTERCILLSERHTRVHRNCWHDHYLPFDGVEASCFQRKQRDR